MSLNLPVDLVKDGSPRRTASTATMYWDLRYRGYAEADGAAVAEVSYEDLTPAQKAARTRAENRAREEAEANKDSVDTSSEAVDTDLTNQAGDANPDA